MLSSSMYTMLKLSKTSPQKLFPTCQSCCFCNIQVFKIYLFACFFMPVFTSMCFCVVKLLVKVVRLTKMIYHEYLYPPSLPFTLPIYMCIFYPSFFFSSFPFNLPSLSLFPSLPCPPSITAWGQSKPITWKVPNYTWVTRLF